VCPQNHATFESDPLDTVQKRSSPDDDETLLTGTSWFIKAHTSFDTQGQKCCIKWFSACLSYQSSDSAC
jgi:hypothetical protein